MICYPSLVEKKKERKKGGEEEEDRCIPRTEVREAKTPANLAMAALYSDDSQSSSSLERRRAWSLFLSLKRSGMPRSQKSILSKGAVKAIAGPTAKPARKMTGMAAQYAAGHGQYHLRVSPSSS